MWGQGFVIKTGLATEQGELVEEEIFVFSPQPKKRQTLE